MGQQVFVTLIGLFRRGEAGELAHGPEPAAVAGGVNAAGVGYLPRIAEVLVVVPIGREISLGIKTPDRHSTDSREARGAIFIKIYAGRLADGLLRGLLQGFCQGGFGPAFLGIQGMAAFKHFCNRIFGNPAQFRLLLLIGHE